MKIERYKNLEKKKTQKRMEYISNNFSLVISLVASDGSKYNLNDLTKYLFSFFYTALLNPIKKKKDKE